MTHCGTTDFVQFFWRGVRELPLGSFLNLCPTTVKFFESLYYGQVCFILAWHYYVSICEKPGRNRPAGLDLLTRGQ
jgi:hypothetical protein